MNLPRGVPKPVFKRTHSCIRIPESVKLEVRIRSGNKCEGRHCANRNGDYRGLVYAHRFRVGPRNKGMGGTRRIPTAADIWRACWPCHLKEDHHL
jgi:hypothetical protein